MTRRVAAVVASALTAAVVVVSLAGCGLRGGRDEPASPAAGPSGSSSVASTPAAEATVDLDADLAAIDEQLNQIDSDVSTGSESEAKEEK